MSQFQRTVLEQVSACQGLLFGEAAHSYLIETDDAVVCIDGAAAPGDLAEIAAVSSKPMVVVLTHAPAFGQSGKIAQAFGAKVLLHEGDASNAWLESNTQY